MMAFVFGVIFFRTSSGFICHVSESESTNTGVAPVWEIELTEAMYVKEGTMYCEMLDWWVDAGTSFDELLRANNLVAEKVKRGEFS